MTKSGISLCFFGFLTSLLSTILIFSHVTTKYNTAVQDMGSIVFGYLSLTMLGLSISVLGIAIIIYRSD